MDEDDFVLCFTLVLSLNFFLNYILEVQETSCGKPKKVRSSEDLTRPSMGPEVNV